MSRLEAARILGIEPSASENEIKNAYIKLARIHHLDSQTGCETKFRQLQTAADVLQKLNKIPNTKTNRNDQEIDPNEIVKMKLFHCKAEYDFYRGEAERENNFENYGAFDFDF